MHCARCGTSNPDGARFCMSCGATLRGTPLDKDPLEEATTEVGAAPRAWRRDRLEYEETELRLPPGKVLLGRFRIEREIGCGGMGRVYLAHDEKLDMEVAIKVLREELAHDAGAMKRLVAEARASMKLSHPNIVRVHDYHEEPLAKFLAMEYVAGETLKDRLDREGKLSEEEARRIGAEICKGLEHAHARKVIHRDLKPGNILLGKDGSVKIADFGIARVCRESMSRLTRLDTSGTDLYMSPEQVMGEWTERSDVYSLGVVLYEMVSGAPPFYTGAIVKQILEKAPKRLEGASEEMNAVVLRCLEKDPAQRFRSAAELREELDGTARRRREEARARAEEARRREEEKRREEARLRQEERRLREERERRQREEAERQRADEARLGEDARAEGGSRHEAERVRQDALVNAMGMEFVAIPAGKFRMGCSRGDNDCAGDENPAHEVEITRGFELGKYEVTQAQWEAVMGSNPSRFKGADRPVERVSWNDAQEFIARLNKLNDGYVYRLPTEAEWEYAARAGATGKYYGELDAIAWYDRNSGGATHPVGQKEPNAFGLYDMLGNVWEWCSDWYGEGYYGKSPARDPKGPGSGKYKVLRGGSWGYNARFVRVSYRYWLSPVARDVNRGLRVAREKK